MSNGMSVQKILLQYEPKREFLLEVLHKINEEFGFISSDNAKFIAQYFGIKPSELYGVMTSSEEIKTQKPHTIEIKVCNGGSCKMERANLVIKEIEKFFKIKADRPSVGKASLETKSCMGLCNVGPIMIVNGNLYERVKPEEVDDILMNY